MDAADAHDAAEAPTGASTDESLDAAADDRIDDPAPADITDAPDNLDIDTASITGGDTATELDDSASALHDIDPQPCRRHRRGKPRARNG